METALVLSGQFRFVEETYPLIKSNLIDNNNIKDIFIHGWYDEDLTKNSYKFGGNGNWQHQRIKENIPDITKNLYNPKLMHVEPSKKYIYSQMDMNDTIKTYYKGALENPNLEPDFRNRCVNNMYSMFYSIMKAYNLCQEYSLANDKRYDCVVRCRTDTEINTPINLSQYDMNKLHYMDLSQPNNMISDWINFSNYEIMGVYSSVFIIHETLFKRQYNRNKKMCNELYIKEALDIFQIPREMHSWNITLPRF